MARQSSKLAASAMFAWDGHEGSSFRSATGTRFEEITNAGGFEIEMASSSSLATFVRSEIASKPVSYRID